MSRRGAQLGIGALLRIGVAILALTGCSKNSTTIQGAQIERVDKEFDLDDDIIRVAIDNPWGEINIRGRDEREVGIHAVVQRLPPTFANAMFKSRKDGTTLRIDVGLEGVDASSATPGRVDIAVYVPSALALDLDTKSGRIAAKKRIGPVTAHTGSGAIEASSFDRLDLASESGQIRAVAIGKRWQGASKVETESGRIILLVPTFGDIALEASTHGRLSTNFGLSVRRLGDGGNEAHARYGAGTSALNVNSARGEVVLEQLILLGDHSPDLEDDD